MKYNPKNLNRKAFTIIELMIATSVLSIILLLVTTMMISIGNLYYKGINQARVQDDVRTISDDLSSHLQLSDQAPQPAITPVSIIISGQSFVMDAVCMDNTRYSYIKDVEIGSNSTVTNPEIHHVLWRDPTPVGGCTGPAPLNLSLPSLNGTELIAPNSRLTDFTISPLTSPYNLSIGVAYGDKNLMSGVGVNTKCNGSNGDQFCSTAALTTTVVQRIQ